MPDSLTDSQTLKDSATQLLKKYKSGALVTQFTRSGIAWSWICNFPVQEDLGSLDGYWGYCSPNCSGELPSPASKYSLTARPDFWNLALFDLSTWGSGICYTYDPPAEVSIPNMRKYEKTY